MKRSNYFLDKPGLKEVVAKLLGKIPTKTSQLENDSGFITEAQAGDVTGVKGNAEATYRRGNVNLTPADIGVEDGAQRNVQSDWDEADEESDAYILNKPTIPTVNDATLTIQRNGTNVQTFTANASSNKTANIEVPTKTSELTDDSIFPYWRRVTDFDDAVNVGMYSALSTATNSPPGSSSHYGISVFRGNSDTLPSQYLFQVAWEIYGSGASFIRKSISLSSTRTWSDWKRIDNVQPNWNETDTTSDAYIQNKPTIPTKTSDLTNDSDFVVASSLVANKVPIDYTSISAGASVTFTMASTSNIAVIFVSRYSNGQTRGIIIMDYWKDNATSLGTTDRITVTKSASSRTVTITNAGTGYTPMVAIGGTFES